MNKSKVLGGILLCIAILVLLNDMISVVSEGGKSSSTLSSPVLGTLFVKAQATTANVDVEDKSGETLMDVISEFSQNDTLSEEEQQTLKDLTNLSGQKAMIDETMKLLTDNKLKYEAILEDIKTQMLAIKKEMNTLHKESELIEDILQEIDK